ncbi:unnamed protein product [Closterium sp. NIES-54]
MAARIASKSRSKIATPDLSRSPQRGISVASGNWARQASVRRPKQRWVACRPPHYSPVWSPVRRTSTSAAAASASSTPPATATAASTSTAATEAPTSTAATEAPTSTTTSTPTPSSAFTTTTAAPTTSSSSLAPLALAEAAPLTRSRRSADRLGANKVDSSSRGNIGQKRNEGAPLKERGTGVTTRGAYNGDTSLYCKEALLEEVDSEGGRAKREEVVPDRAESVRESSRSITYQASILTSSQVFAAASKSSPASAPCSCRPLSHETLLWHHRLGHPSLPRLRGMASHALVSGLPRSLPPLPPGPALTCVPCVEGRQRAAPQSSSFPPTEAPLQTLQMDMWGPARVRGQGHERYFLLVVDDYSRYTTVFPLRSKGEVPESLLSIWGIHQTFTLPASPQQNGIAERRIGMVMDVARTSMIHAAAPHFLWPFAVQYATHQINLQPRVSLPETTPTLRWTGKVGDASAFRVWGSRAFVRDTTADKLSSHASRFPPRNCPLPYPPVEQATS